MEICRGRFLSTLLPNCVWVKEWHNDECALNNKVHQGVISEDEAVRLQYLDY
jgi:hypothetical protein